MLLGLQPQSERGSHSLRHRAIWAATKALREFHASNGFYPPKLDGRAHYGPWDNSLVQPIKVQPSIRADYVGPIIDPFRETAAFPNEVLMKVHYTGSRNPESDKWPWRYFRGYAPRYYRSEDGQAAFVVSNGPDRDVDVGKPELARASRQTSAILVWKELVPFFYDPTNGTGYDRTDGDVIDVVQPN